MLVWLDIFTSSIIQIVQHLHRRHISVCLSVIGCRGWAEKTYYTSWQDQDSSITILFFVIILLFFWRNTGGLAIKTRLGTWEPRNERCGVAKGNKERAFACVCWQHGARDVFSSFFFFSSVFQPHGTNLHYSPITLITAGENRRNDRRILLNLNEIIWRLHFPYCNMYVMRVRVCVCRGADWGITF